MTVNFVTIALAIGLVGLAAAYAKHRGVMSHSPGSARMQQLSDDIHTGAMAFLRRMYYVVIPFLIVVGALLAVALTWRAGAAYVAGASCTSPPSRWWWTGSGTSSPWACWPPGCWWADTCSPRPRPGSGEP